MPIEDYALLGALQTAALVGRDVERRRQVGNSPQAFSHLALINTARAITAAEAARRTPAAVG